MRANIHIRQHNEEKWAAIPDKSNWINTLLEHSGDTSELGAVVSTPVGPATTVLSEIDPPAKALAALESIVEAFPELSFRARADLQAEGKLCRHGAPVKFCKYAKPGKPCK